MEAVHSDASLSGIPPASSADPFAHVTRGSQERSYKREGSAMATAVISPPTSLNHHPHSAYQSAYMSTTTMPSMISPVQSRRTSDDSNSHHRRSLPSIQEVIHGKPPVFNPASAGPTGPSTPTLPSPFSSNASSRTFADTIDKHPSPRSLHPATGYPPRPESVSSFSGSVRPLSARPPPPPSINTRPGQARHASPPRIDHADADRSADPRKAGGAFAFPPQPPLQQNLYPQTGRLPPGQLPLTGYPASPRQVRPSQLSPYDSQRPGMYGDDEYLNRREEFKATPERGFDSWSYSTTLREIGSSARTVFNFVDAFESAAREQAGSQPIPSRLPTEREVSMMINNTLLMKKKLEEVREMALQNRLHMERCARESERKGFADEEDMAMYSDMGKNYGMNEVKKRRGRAAPPGRCHSCNRIDTPEWRRGPDGARTLCNACGLHYAKLERKRQHEAKNIRSKPPTEDR